MINKLFFALIFLGIYSASATAALTGVSSVNSGVAGAGRSSVELSTIPFLNPATLGFMRGYHFTSNFSSDSNRVENQNTLGQTLSVGLMDNGADSAFPGSFGFRQQKIGNEVNQQIRLSTAHRLVKKNTSFGFAISQNQTKINSETESQINASLGILHSFNARWGVALVGQNLVPNEKFESSHWFQREIGIGGTFHYKGKARFQADYILSNDRISKAAFGVENFINDWAILRLGTERNLSEKKNLYAVGFGFNLPRFLIHYAYQFEDKDSSHSIDLTLPLW